MTKKELLQKLQTNISETERAALKESDSGLIIGKYNRQILNDMLKMSTADEETVDEKKISALAEHLKKYLNQYMEQTEGHKWVILASLYNTFVLEVPMHPIEVTNVKTVIRDGQKEYYCPCKEEQEGSVCRYCVCRKQEE